MDFQIQYIGDVVIGDWGLQATQSKWSRLQREVLKKEDAIRTGPGRISSHCDIICTEASPGRISSHCDVICTGPGPGGITRANKFTSWHYLHGGITGQTIHMRGQDMSYYSRAHGGPRLFSMGAAPGQILSRALHEPTHACKWQYGARDIFIYICIVTNHEQCIP